MRCPIDGAGERGAPALRCAALVRVCGASAAAAAADRGAAARAQPWLAVWGGCEDGALTFALVCASSGTLAPPWRERWHSAAVTVVATAADDAAELLTASADGLVLLWRLAQPARAHAMGALGGVLGGARTLAPFASVPPLPLRGHVRGIVAGALCPTAHVAATADACGRLLLHCTADCTLLRVVEPRERFVNAPPYPPLHCSVDVSGCGLVALALGGALRVFSSAGELLHELHPPAGAAGCRLVAFVRARALLGGAGAADALCAADADGTTLLLVAGPGFLRAHRVGGADARACTPTPTPGGAASLRAGASRVAPLLEWRNAPAAPAAIAFGVGAFASMHVCVAAGASGGGVGAPSIAAFALEPEPLLDRPTVSLRESLLAAGRQRSASG